MLKVSWRHTEAEHEADALELWDGDGAVRCLAAQTRESTSVLLLERCVPGSTLASVLPEPEQDIVLARLLRRPWEHRPSPGSAFRPLAEICDQWADSFERDLERNGGRGLDAALAHEGMALLRELPRTSERTVLLCVDLHAENILAAEREPWLIIDPKPFLGDPAFDAVQHMLNCDQRLGADPVALARRMAQLLELDADRGQALAARAVRAGVAPRSDHARASQAASTVNARRSEGMTRTGGRRVPAP